MNLRRFQVSFWHNKSDKEDVVVVDAEDAITAIMKAVFQLRNYDELQCENILVEHLYEVKEEIKFVQVTTGAQRDHH